jgi:S-DNA-T family DNA segregation ATPase FtsK/SpoIIIE
MAKRWKTRARRAGKSVLTPTRFEMNPDVRREILATVMIAIGGLLMLSLLSVGGLLGQIANQYLSLIFGVGKYIFVLMFLGTGIALMFPRQYPLRVVHLLGVVLFLSAFCSLWHLFGGTETALIRAQEGQAGGMLGFFVNRMLSEFMGFWPLLLVDFAALLIAILILINQSFGTLVGLAKSIFPTGRKKVKINEIKVHELPGDNVVNPFTKNEVEEPVVKEIAKETKPFSSVSLDAEYLPPPLDLLESESGTADSGDIKKNLEIIEKTLATFNVPVEMRDVHVGPTVTQYTLAPEEGVKLQQITALANDLSLALAAHPLRIEAPIPGKSLVGIEIPNKKIALVRLRGILESGVASNMTLGLSLGLDVSGKPCALDLAKMPHLLIAGATGSGKSVCINSFILSLLYGHSPRDLRLILVDPKRVELTCYNDIPHLLTPVIVEPEPTVRALGWLVSEMNRRYKLFQAAGARNLDSFNEAASPENKLPYIVLFIDELADLMAVSAKEVEGYICRLAQMARATGIHLVIATQRPSVDVITGLIKANISARICFNVASQIDSRTVLDIAGAEKLLGRGDMLYLSPELSKPRRLQGVYISDKEIHSVAEFVRSQGKPAYEEAVISQARSQAEGIAGAESDDPLYQQAYDVVVSHQKASASLLQRRLSIGYARAARLLDILESNGVIGPGDGAKPREVLVSKQDYSWES